jgi:hypothetical protein
MKVGNGFRAYPVGNGEFQQIERPPGESDISSLADAPSFSDSLEHTQNFVFI